MTQQQLAITICRCRSSPEPGQIKGELNDALPIQIGERGALAGFECFVLSFEFFDGGELVVPFLLERAADDTIVGIASIVLAIGTLRFVASTLEAKLPLLVEGVILFLDRIDDPCRVE